MVDKVKQGKKNKASGADFERRVRKDLTEKGWIVEKWSNNVEFDYDADKFYKVPKGTTALLKPAKNKWAGPNRPMMMGAGFPDFIAFRKVPCSTCYARTKDTSTENYRIYGVECKVAKYLDKIEKEKCEWLLKNKIFSKVLIAFKTKEKNRVKVNYIEFK